MTIPKGLSFRQVTHIIFHMSQALTFSRLQKVDLQRDQIQTRLKAIDRALQDDAHLKAARQGKEDADAALADAKKDLRKREETVRNQNIKIEETDSALYGGRVKNPKELQDLQQEIAALRRHLVTLEDQQLNAMLALDEADTAQKAADEALRDTEEKFNTAHSELISEREALSKDLERLRAERQAIAGNIPPDSLQIYDKLRQQRGGIAVASVEDQSCSACGAELTPADCQAAKSTTRITYCPTCGRILYGG